MSATNLQQNDTHKFCRKCNQWLLHSAYYKDRKRKGGLGPMCKGCHNSYMRDRYASNPEHARARKDYHKNRIKNEPDYRAMAKVRSDNFYASLEGRAKTLLNGAKRRDKNATVTLDHIRNLLIDGICPVTGIKFELSHSFRLKTGRYYNPYSPSLDQIKPKNGYSNENTRLVIWQYNLMKGELSDTEILMICNSIVARSNRD